MPCHRLGPVFVAFGAADLYPIAPLANLDAANGQLRLSTVMAG